MPDARQLLTGATDVDRSDVEPVDPKRNADVLIVVPCLNEERHLPALLADLLRDAHGACVVVADGGSTDRSRDIVLALARGHANLRLVDNPRRIQSAAVNLAARRHGARRKWLVRIAPMPGILRGTSIG